MGGRVSTGRGRVRGALRRRAAVRGLPVPPAVPPWVPVSAARGGQGLAQRTGADDLFGVQLRGVLDGRDDLPGHPQAVDAVVAGHLLGDDAEGRCERPGAPAHPGPGELRHVPEMAPKAAACRYASWARASLGGGRRGPGQRPQPEARGSRPRVAHRDERLTTRHWMLDAGCWALTVWPLRTRSAGAAWGTDESGRSSCRSGIGSGHV